MSNILALFMKFWLLLDGKKTLIGWLTSHAAIFADPMLRQKFLDLITNPSKENAFLFGGYWIISIGLIDRVRKQFNSFLDSKGVNVKI